MNDWQALRQIQKIIRSLTWEGGNKLFASSNVDITTLVIENYVQVKRTSTPFSTIRLLTSTSDPVWIQKGLSSIEVTICTSLQGDDTGEMSIMGKNDPPASSKGKGVLSFEPIFLAAMGKRTESGGVKFTETKKSAGDIQFINESENISFRQYTFEFESTSFKTFLEPLRFRVTGGSGSASIYWTKPSQFGFSKVTLKRGSTVVVDNDSEYPSSPYSDSGLPPGSKTYTIQAFYDDKSSDSDQESIILTKTVTVT